MNSVHLMKLKQNVFLSLSANTGKITTYLSSLCAERSDSALLGMGGGGREQF
jgi:hypothetical protein